MVEISCEKIDAVKFIVFYIPTTLVKALMVAAMFTGVCLSLKKMKRLEVSCKIQCSFTFLPQLQKCTVPGNWSRDLHRVGVKGGSETFITISKDYF